MRSDPRNSETVSDSTDGPPPVSQASGADGGIEGRVVSGGRPASDVAVAIESAPVPLPDIASLTGAGGEYALSGLPAGEYRIAFHAPSGRRSSRTMRVKANTVVRCDVDMDKGPE